MENKLDILIQHKTKVNKLLNQLRAKSVADPRNIILSHQRSLISPRKWRLIKSNVQTLAGRSFIALRDSFEMQLQEVVNLFKNNEIEKQDFKNKVNLIFKTHYQRAYMFGLKAAGLGISQNYNAFVRLSKAPVLGRRDLEYLLNTQNHPKVFCDYFLKNYTKIIPLEFYRLLQAQYDQGRINGAPNNSLIYWKADKTNNCKLCKYMEELSPWALELLPILPASCKKCFSNFRIIPKTALEYRKYLDKLTPDLNHIKYNIKKLILQ